MGEKRDLEVESVSLGKFSELFTIEIRILVFLTARF